MMLSPKNVPAGQGSLHTLHWAGQAWLASPCGALLHEATRTLFVADLHLEKGSWFAAKSGQLLPPYDSLATLATLRATIQATQASQLVCLGDSFHDTHAEERLPLVVREALTALGHDLSVQWIVGNHDKELPAGLTGSVAVAYEGCGVRGVHSIETIPVTPTIIGHYHPKVAVTSHGKRLWRPCFAYSENVMILPSYGAFTGGLSIKDRAFQRILGSKPSLIALGEARVYPLRLDAVI